MRKSTFVTPKYATRHPVNVYIQILQALRRERMVLLNGTNPRNLKVLNAWWDRVASCCTRCDRPVLVILMEVQIENGCKAAAIGPALC